MFSGALIRTRSLCANVARPSNTRASSRCSCCHRVIRRSDPGVYWDFDRTVSTSVGPVAPQHLVGFFVCIAIRQPLPGRTTIGVFLRQIDKVPLTDAPVRLSARNHRLGQSYRDAGLMAGEDLRAAEVAAIGDGLERFQRELLLDQLRRKTLPRRSTSGTGITSVAGAILINAPTLGGRYLLQGQAVAISRTTGVYALPFSGLSRRKGERGAIGVTRTECSRT